MGQENERANEQSTQNRYDQIDPLSEKREKTGYRSVGKILNSKDELNKKNRSQTGDRPNYNSKNEEKKAFRR
jgi:hypothetical protein